MPNEIDKSLKKDKIRLSEAEILKYLSEPLNVIAYETTDSTNTRARALLEEGKVPPFLLVAEEQTAGRGRRGHSFFSPESGLYYTLVLKPDDMNLAIQKTTIAAAAALEEAIQETAGITCEIKWVNDLYLERKKISGILCEAPCGKNGEPLGIIIGIGINIAQKEFPEELRDIAGSLNRPDLDRNVLSGALTNRLLYWINRLNDPMLMQNYRNHSLLLGKKVSFNNNGKTVEAIAKDINDEGNLIVEADRSYTLNSGEVSLLSWE